MTGLKVLLVDDDERVIKSFRRLLRNSFSMDTALSGAEGLKLMEEHGPYAVVVSDFRMPGMDGVEFLKQAMQHYPDTVRIMLTGFADLQTAAKAVNQSQVFRFLTKPCPPKLLSDALFQAIKFYEFTLSERELIGLRQWRKSLEQIVVALVRLVESRDPYTAGHQQRVAQLARAIALEMGMDDERVESINMAATVHDVGKVYVPLEFLNKPGVLSESEFNIIRHHPKVGYDILSQVDFESPVSEMVLQHHERLDGSGYPNGLSGSDILPESRVIAVADVVEAMSSHRPYRASRGLENALLEIEKNAGSHYDGDAVSACLLLFREKGFSFESQS